MARRRTTGVSSVALESTRSRTCVQHAHAAGRIISTQSRFMNTSENAWHCGASLSEKLSALLKCTEMFFISGHYTHSETIHEQIEFCGEHI